MADTKMLNTAQAADLLGVSQATLRKFRTTKYAAPGRLSHPTRPPWFRHGGRVVYDEVALRAWMAECKAAAGAPAPPAAMKVVEPAPTSGDTASPARLRRAPAVGG